MLNGREVIWGIKVISKSQVQVYIWFDLWAEMGGQFQHWHMSLCGWNGIIVLKDYTGHKRGSNPDSG